MAESASKRKRRPQKRKIGNQNQSKTKIQQNRKKVPSKSVQKHQIPMSRKKRKNTVNRKLPAPKRSYKALTIIVFLLFTMYLCRYIWVFLNKPSIPVEVVTYGSIESPSTLEGLIVREEYTVTSDRAGMPTYAYSELEKVPKNEIICTIRDEETSQIIEEKINNIDKDILKNLQKRSDLSIFQEDVSRIESNIDQLIGAYNGKFMEENIMDIASLKNQISSEMNQRTEIWLTENVDSVQQLSQEKSQYQQQLEKSISTIKAQQGGILSFQIDGQESVLTPENLDSIEQKQVSTKITPKYLSKTGVVEENEVLFKIVTSNHWYIVSYLPPEVVGGWQEGDAKYLYTTVKEEEKRIPVTVQKLSVNEKEARVVFLVTQDILSFIGQRNISFRVQSTSLEGIKIPNNAIVEKTVLKIPVECVMETMGEQGVLKMVNGKGEFVALEFTRYSEAEGFAYVVQDFSSLKVGDVIAEGTGENAGTYTISEVETMQGVFVGNSSIAKFTAITIIGQNEEYTIVSPGSSSYELQAYDTIVSDAKNIGENQTLY